MDVLQTLGIPMGGRSHHRNPHPSGQWTVSVSCTFDVTLTDKDPTLDEQAADAVRQMVAWLSEDADLAGYRAWPGTEAYPHGVEGIFIDAAYLHYED